MTPTEINIAIAEACGWHIMKNHAQQDIWTNGKESRWLPPSYTTDLNAMHEAEKSLHMESDEHDMCVMYGEELEKVCSIVHSSDDWRYLQRIITATASQRAEAFLRTIGKWKD